MSEVIALIGLGNMGGPIASRWIAGGLDVVGFDVSAAARNAFEQRGGVAAASIAAAVAQASAIVLLLPDSNAVDKVIDELLVTGALTSDQVIIDMSSSEPERTRANATRLAEVGVRFLDAPVSGGVSGARAGTLTIMVGGPADVAETRRALLEHLGRVIHVGGPGSGHAVKALNNLLSAIHLWATSEAVLVANRFGVEPTAFLEVVNGSSGRSGSSEAKWPKFILPGTFDSGFSARLMLKDARIATGLAKNVGLPTQLGEEAVKEWSAAVDTLPESADHTEIVRFLRGETAEDPT